MNSQVVKATLSKSAFLTALLALTCVSLLATASATAQFQVLYTFDPIKTAPGTDPTTALVSDAAGNLYGTTAGDIDRSSGEVFELVPHGEGYTFHVIFVFNLQDGREPIGNLVVDSVGNLYGVTVAGGANYRGTIFELSPTNGRKKWVQTTLYNFTDAAYGPVGVTMDTHGNLFGSTSCADRTCYTAAGATAFELSPAGNGQWTYNTIYNFTEAEGGAPTTQLTVDANGNLYGGQYTLDGTYSGLFELSPGSGGVWTETTVHTFNAATDGAAPNGALVIDSSGNLYGTNSFGGTYGAGTAFEVTPVSGGWTFTVMHTFGGNPLTDGYYPVGGLIFDSAGNAYGATNQVGPTAGNVFRLTPQANGQWNEAILYSFTDGADGGYPYNGVFMNSAGNLVGITREGGFTNSEWCTLGCGTVYEIRP